jgi:Domain of unknown function (DUF4386)
MRVEAAPSIHPSTRPPISPTQHSAARLVGILYLLQMAAGVFGFWAKGQVIAPGAAETAANLAASGRLFRLGLAADLLTALIVIGLTVALFMVLEPVRRGVTLFAAFLRVAENAIGGMTVLNAFVALRLLGGAGYLEAIDDRQLQAMARLFLGIQGQGLQIAFVFLGLGSAAFSWVWLQSRYIPRAIAIWGIFASLTLSIVTLVILVVPALGQILGLTYMAPMGIYEVGLGVWLLVRGLRVTHRRAPAEA